MECKMSEALAQNTYPGRCILAGLTKDGKCAAVAYSIMGRSENSRNRIFVEDGDGLRTQAFDPAKLSDPSLVIYAPLKVLGSQTIVTNGDQTDTIYDCIAKGGRFEEALRTREFEPDGPNWTPRISALLDISGGKLGLKMSILKSGDTDGKSCNRYFYEYEAVTPGTAKFIHTYLQDGSPIPSFEGEPRDLILEGDSPEAMADILWQSLNADNKVSLFVRFIPLDGSASKSVIINKHR